MFGRPICFEMMNRVSNNVASSKIKMNMGDITDLLKEVRNRCIKEQRENGGSEESLEILLRGIDIAEEEIHDYALRLEMGNSWTQVQH